MRCVSTKEILILILEKYFSYVSSKLQFSEYTEINMFKADFILFLWVHYFKTFTEIFKT